MVKASNAVFGPGTASASRIFASESCHFLAFIASCAADICLAIVLLILPPPVQAAVCAAAGALRPTERIPIVAAITRPVRIDTHTLRVTQLVRSLRGPPPPRSRKKRQPVLFAWMSHIFAMRVMPGVLLTV